MAQERSQSRPAEPGSLSWRRVVFMPEDVNPRRTLLLRIILVVALLLSLFVVLLLDRDGLIDHSDGEVSFVDVIYFTMVTITTVGYGDIVPVTPRARLIDALVITPVRIFIWVLFLGTAYQLALRQFSEGFRMAKLHANLHQHIIVCGYGHTGNAAVKELLAKGTPKEQILVIDPQDDRVRAAVKLGVAALRGDATKEGLLKDVALVNQARAVIISAGRDDANALILLTVRHLAPSCRVIMSAKEQENVKLFRQGGAQRIISPSTYGGYLLAAAVNQRHMTQYMEDLLTAGGRVNLVEEAVRDEDVGKTPADLKPDVLLCVFRQGSTLSPWEFKENECLEPGDVLLLLKQAQETT
ncbi:MAG: potassium channel family protein [Nitrospirales bacterium]|nr:potassium channel family protein [Nitrospira sp.]MDR4501002.1 potassium channel family protein [Nitrospirales bacterium]